MSRRVLFIGDAVVATGFSRLNHAYIAGLQSAGWDVHVLALNYYGDPHGNTFKAYPCASLRGGDPFGLKRSTELTLRLRPDVVSITNDPWNIQEYLKRIGSVPTVASLAVDGKNCRGSELNGLALAVFWTQFGLSEAKLGGFRGRGEVIPLGVDLDVYSPGDRVQARYALGLPEAVKDAFIVGVVGRNQPRKRLDLTLMAFAQWIRQKRVDDAFLYLHVGPTGDAGFDLLQLGQYLGISNRMIIAEPEIGQGISEQQLATTYRAFDCMLTTTQGEGWGLTHMEGMACGVPQIVPDWSALGEWARDAARLVPCSSVACTPNNINVLGGVANIEATVLALEDMYQDPEVRQEHVDAGLALVARPEFRWGVIGGAFAQALDSALHPKRLKQRLAEQEVEV